MSKYIARGTKSSLMLDFETQYGVAPATPAGVKLPVNTIGLKASRAKNSANTLTGRRDPVQPFDGNTEVAGAVVVPVDTLAFGHWLKAMFGDPVTTGDAAPYTHVFKPGDEMPSLFIQTEYGTKPATFAQYTGCKVGSMAISFGGDGELTASLNLSGRDVEFAETSHDTTATLVPMKRLGNFQSSLSDKGTGVGIVTEGSLDINFGLDTTIRALGGEGKLHDILEGIMAVTGNITTMFTSKELLEKARKSEEMSLELKFQIDAENALSFTLPEVQINFETPAVDGPTGVKMQLPFVAYFNNSTENSVVIATLINDVASY